MACWQCHKATRTEPCEHCACETPTDKRDEYAAEEALLDLVFRHMGNGYLLRVPHDTDSDLSCLVPGRYPPGFTQTVVTVSARALALLKTRDMPYEICALTEQTERNRVGWREMGLDGANFDWYVCLR